MIRSNTHAFEILETPVQAIPYKAIRYLYFQPPAEDIRSKVIYWLENALNSDSSEKGGEAPLWFAIIAEKYPEEALIDPVINLYTTVDKDWGLLNDQGTILVINLCEALGDLAVERFLNAMIQQVEAESDLPFLYLFDCFRFIDPAKYPEQILALLNKSNYWLESMLEQFPIIPFSQKKHPELLEKIHQKLEILRLEYELMETNDHIERNVLKRIPVLQETLSKADYPATKESFLNREDWETHYRALDPQFEPQLGPRLEQGTDEKTVTNIKSPLSIPKKISRNASCPCGSGKKYKRCCL